MELNYYDGQTIVSSLVQRKTSTRLFLRCDTQIKKAPSFSKGLGNTLSPDLIKTNDTANC